MSNEATCEDGTNSVGGYSSDEKLSKTSGEDSSNRDGNNQIGHLVEKEDKQVIRSKLLLVFVILVATAAASTVTFRFTTSEENDDFETRFTDFANQIIEVSQINAIQVFKTYESMSLSLTAYALGTRSSWPFVTFPAFEAQGQQALDQTDADFIAVAHLVSNENREQWENYTVHNQWWVQEGLDFQGKQVNATNVIPYIYQWNEPEKEGGRPGLGEAKLGSKPYFAPFWQTSPASEYPFFTNFNTYNYAFFDRVFDGMVKANRAVLSEVVNLPSAFTNSTYELSEGDDESNWPTSFMCAPVYDKTSGKRNLVAFIVSFLPWHRYFQNLIPPGINGINLVVSNTCAQTFSYRINGPEVVFLGNGDIHETAYDDLGVATDFTTFTSIEECLVTFHLYPSKEFESSYASVKPKVYTIGVVAIFFLTAIFFAIYDIFVERRQGKVVDTAARSNAIVNSLFPANVRDRLMDGAATDPAHSKNSKADTNILARHGFVGPHHQTNNANHESKPIADLFPNATVMFSDISGFTAWSSVREPSQVFLLLETVYNSFDRIAKRLKVFKVETIGDSYVAAAGLPEARKDHAVVMARFARDCLIKMNQVVQQLEVSLGPETADLSMRFGLHSGPVTAGVLRGEKSRFQLFGDTVNTAARMESTGVRNKIHISQETANLLIESGKANWVIPRDDEVNAKGKGFLKTYFIEFGSRSDSAETNKLARQSSMFTETMGEHVGSDCHSGMDPMELGQLQGDATVAAEDDANKSREQRLIGWNVEILLRLLKQIVAMRSKQKSRQSLSFKFKKGMTVLDEVQEIITLPSEAAKYKQDPETIDLGQDVYDQLYEYVKSIASLYRDNSFHSFDHCSHVVQSTVKLMSRIVTPDAIDYGDMSYKIKQEVKVLHKYTFGITSDPLIQFTSAFAALIHDVDHTGVPNAVLVEEGSDIAAFYGNKSVAEQHSVDLAWELLMEEQYADLRACIYSTQEELNRFRQLVVNCVMATDIADKELGQLRKKRWEKAFNTYGSDDDDDVVLDKGDSTKEATDRKATIVVEHLIQASDVSHTMQHWHVYLKWNEKLFHEMYKAYLDGRSKVDPSQGWYQGELGFFDFYIIPLAKKLAECGVFGVSSDEYLNYAQANRAEWEIKGKDIVQQYMSRYTTNKESEIV